MVLGGQLEISFVPTTLSIEMETDYNIWTKPVINHSGTMPDFKNPIKKLLALSLDSSRCNRLPLRLEIGDSKSTEVSRA
jgi:hypothetical protein